MPGRHHRQPFPRRLSILSHDALGPLNCGDRRRFVQARWVRVNLTACEVREKVVDPFRGIPIGRRAAGFRAAEEISLDVLISEGYYRTSASKRAGVVPKARAIFTIFNNPKLRSPRSTPPM